MTQSIETNSPTAVPPRHGGATATLALAALGIVFGDLGTSPLYALQEAFHGANGVSASPAPEKFFFSRQKNFKKNMFLFLSFLTA